MSTLSIIMSFVLTVAVMLTVVYVMSLKTREDELHKAEDALQEDRRNLDAEMQKFKSDQETAWLKLSAKQHELEEQKKHLDGAAEKLYDLDRKVTEKMKIYGEPTILHTEVMLKKGEKVSSARKRLASAIGYAVLKTGEEYSTMNVLNEMWLIKDIRILK